jgi:hypothetical protein
VLIVKGIGVGAQEQTLHFARNFVTTVLIFGQRRGRTSKKSLARKPAQLSINRLNRENVYLPFGEKLLTQSV